MVFDLKRDQTPVEQAVLGFHMQRAHGTGNPTDWPNDVNSIARKVFDKWVTNVTSTGYWPTSCVLSRCETYHLDATTGKTRDKGVALAAASPGGWAGVSTTASLPWECSCAVSLYCYDPAGFDPLAKYKRGRFYLPPFMVNVMGNGPDTGGYTSSVIGTIANDMQRFLNDVHGLVVGPEIAGGGDQMWVGVLSRTRNLFTRLQTMRIGRAPDTQRRRGKNVPELYTNFAIAQS